MTNKKASDVYQKLSQIEHVIHRPETYVGSTISELKEMFVVEDINNIENLKLVKKVVKYNPAFLKIFDEILTNASDHYVRTNEKVSKIKIEVTPTYVSIYNDGPGIPIEIHDKEKIYIPEMILGQLLTGENFNDVEKRYTGGRNGMGAVLCNIFSTKFIVDCADGKNSYYQVFENNLSKKSLPDIKKCKNSYTKITFYPDFKKFGMEEISENEQKLFLRRVIDIAMYCTNADVYYNDKKIPLKNFKDFVKLYVGENELFYEKVADNWEIAVSKSNDDIFEQVSIVNGIATYDGGTHVNLISTQIAAQITEQLQKKYKKSRINQNDIKRNLFVFVNCKIVNPAFSTQTKESLITKIINVNINISDGFIKKILTSSMIEDIIRYIEAKELASLKKESGKKTVKVRLKKLEDANKAGSLESNRANLFLTEGDSSLGTALAGFASVGRDYYGAFPLKGKPLNVREVSLDKIKENEEIKNIVTALGLEFGKKYETINELRYGKLTVFSDADADGTHIKGLIVNLLDTFWPELLEKNFLYEFVSPIIKASKGDKLKYFYKLQDYKKFKELPEAKGWSFKYLKGIGSIEDFEAEAFFKDIDKHLIKFQNTDPKKTKEYVDLLFNKKRADDRKEWLLSYKPGVEIDKFTQPTTYESFFRDEFIEFSMYDNIRSIPSIVDGLKPSQRKILYTMLLKNYSSDVKVANLIGTITEQTSYHHGEASLYSTIVGMSQNFVGSNNINFLLPKGNFGSRLQGGADSASARYIFTMLNPITKKIFNSQDDNILNYLNDDGFLIEPEYYIPIIPTVLVNGAKGIGTGYSTDIPQFNYKDLIHWYQNKLENKTTRKEIIPYYEGFKGTVTWDEENRRYITRGIVKELIKNSVYQITELPIGTWTNKYIDFLDDLYDKKLIKDYNKNCSNKEINIKVWVSDGVQLDNLYKFFNLETYIKLDNMNAFDENGKLKRYKDQYEILEEFYKIRLKWYQKRKDYLIDKLEDDKKWMIQKMKFIKAILEKKFDFVNKSKVDIEILLDELGVERYEESFDYLLNLRIYTLTKEKLLEIKQQFEDLKIKIDNIRNMKIENMWLEDLKNIK